MSRTLMREWLIKDIWQYILKICKLNITSINDIIYWSSNGIEGTFLRMAFWTVFLQNILRGYFFEIVLQGIFSANCLLLNLFCKLSSLSWIMFLHFYIPHHVLHIIVLGHFSKFHEIIFCAGFYPGSFLCKLLFPIIFCKRYFLIFWQAGIANHSNSRSR